MLQGVALQSRAGAHSATGAQVNFQINGSVEMFECANKHTKKTTNRWWMFQK
jgi:hypothetical protein